MNPSLKKLVAVAAVAGAVVLFSGVVLSHSDKSMAAMAGTGEPPLGAEADGLAMSDTNGPMAEPPANGEENAAKAEPAKAAPAKAKPAKSAHKAKKHGKTRKAKKTRHGKKKKSKKKKHPKHAKKHASKKKAAKPAATQET